MTALNPQITKSYASGDYEFMFKLVYQGARFSYYMPGLCLEQFFQFHDNSCDTDSHQRYTAD
jgi:hypothetical protein